MKIAITYIIAVIIWIIVAIGYLTIEAISFSAFFIVLTVIFMNLLTACLCLGHTIRIITAIKSIINQLTNVKED